MMTFVSFDTNESESNELYSVPYPGYCYNLERSSAWVDLSAAAACGVKQEKMAISPACISA